MWFPTDGESKQNGKPFQNAYRRIFGETDSDKEDRSEKKKKNLVSRENGATSDSDDDMPLSHRIDKLDEGKHSGPTNELLGTNKWCEFRGKKTIIVLAIIYNVKE